MPKIPQCACCSFYARDPHVVCAIHPDGPADQTCLDLRINPELEGKHFVDFLGIGEEEQDEDLWEPQGATYYNGELILQPRQRWTQQQQLELVETHPLFTRRCPVCGCCFETDYTRVHWDCPDPECGWIDDSV